MTDTGAIRIVLLADDGTDRADTEVGLVGNASERASLIVQSQDGVALLKTGSERTPDVARLGWLKLSELVLGLVQFCAERVALVVQVEDTAVLVAVPIAVAVFVARQA
jgi:hypothetical protein